MRRASLLLITITILATGISGQQDDRTERDQAQRLAAKQQEPSAKDAAKAAKEQEKSAKKAWKEEIKNRTVNLRDVTLFPQNHLNRPLRIERAIIEGLKPYVENGTTYYFLDVASSTRDASTMSFPLANSVTFVVSEDVAKEIAARSGYKNYGFYSGNVNPIADLWFVLLEGTHNSQKYYIAKASCVVFAGLKSSSVGTCL